MQQIQQNNNVLNIIVWLAGKMNHILRCGVGYLVLSVQETWSYLMPAVSHKKNSVLYRERGRGGGSEPPASCACYSWFLPLSVVLPASCSHLYCKILGKYCKIFSQLPLVPATLGILLSTLFSPAFRPFLLVSRPPVSPFYTIVMIHDTFSNGKTCLTLFLCVSVISYLSSTLVNKNGKKTKIQHLEQPPGQ